MRKIKFLAAALCFCSGSLFAQLPTYTPGSNIAAGRTTGTYSISANTVGGDGPGMGFFGKDNTDRPGCIELTSFNNPSNPSTSQYGLHYARTNGTTWTTQFVIDKFGKAGIGSFPYSWITSTFQVDVTHNRVGIGTLGINTFGDEPGVHRTTAMLAGNIGYIGFNALRNSGNGVELFSDNTNNGGAIIAGTINGGLNFMTIKSGAYGGSTGTQWLNSTQLAASVKMSINPDGQVKIGAKSSTSHPDALLSVAGKFVAQSIYCKATSDWADYVFEPTYKLKKLSEVEEFVKVNKHLPEVPSAKEVEENGLNIADMDAVLLKKIEELTLYMIELEKKNERLETQLKSLIDKK